MNAMELPDDLQRCVDFHGHLCPGVVIGYRAATAGMDELSVRRAGDEELIAIVENNTCAVDAIQWLTGCTFGKGNLYFHDYGKMVFTFATRANGRSIRLRLRPTDTTDAEEVPADQRRRRYIEYLLSQESSKLFEIQTNTLEALPEKASIHESLPCDCCGEMVMATRLRQRDGKSLCIPCDEDARQERQSP